MELETSAEMRRLTAEKSLISHNSPLDKPLTMGSSAFSQALSCLRCPATFWMDAR
jgi:hypothetical protein